MLESIYPLLQPIIKESLESNSTEASVLFDVAKQFVKDVSGYVIEDELPEWLKLPLAYIIAKLVSVKFVLVDNGEGWLSTIENNFKYAIDLLSKKVLTGETGIQFSKSVDLQSITRL